MIAQATAIAVALCCLRQRPLLPPTPAPPVSPAARVAPATSPPTERKEFTEDNVNAAVGEESSTSARKDGAFVFRDPKLNADLHLVFEKVKIVRGMEGYGWFANTIFHDKDNPKKQYAIDFWFKPDGKELKLMDIRVQKGPKQDGDSYYHDHAHAGGLVVAAGAGASGRYGGDARLARDERDP